MKLDSATFPTTVQVGTEHRCTWQRDTHGVDIDLEGHVVIIRKPGCRPAVVGVASLRHGFLVVSEGVKK